MFNRVLALFVPILALPPAIAAEHPSFADRQQPMFRLMEVEEAWKITRGGPDCTVGVIDSGFDFFHPALAASLKPGWFAPGFYHTDFFTMDAHGTLVASLIAARRTPDQDGMWGLAPGCTVLAAAQGMPLHELYRWQSQFFARNPKATPAELQKELQPHTAEITAWNDLWLEYVFGTVADATHYLADHDARVINMSLFLDTAVLSTRPSLRARIGEAFAYAKQKDVLIVVGAGNTDKRVTDYPGDRDFVMVAGASTLDDRRWSIKVPYMGVEVAQGSCYGPRLSVMAPVENIVVAGPHEEGFYSWNDTPMGKQKALFEGSYSVRPWGATSSAAPQVAALAALVRSLRPDLRAVAVARVIEQGADPIGAPGFHEETGFGWINFRKTLELARKSDDRR